MKKIYSFILIFAFSLNLTFAADTFSDHLAKASENKKVLESLSQEDVKQIEVKGLNKSILNSIQLSYITKPVSFVYNNSGKLLSKNTLATVMILGAPYIYFTDTDILACIATVMSDMTFKISEAAMTGMLRAAYNNRMIVAKLSTIFAAKFVTAEAAKTGVSEGVKYSLAALGSFIRGYFGWKSYGDLVK